VTFYKLRQLYEHPAVQPRVLSMERDQDNLPLLYRQIGKSGKWQKAAVEKVSSRLYGDYETGLPRRRSYLSSGVLI
jgi:hypothetical protein